MKKFIAIVIAILMILTSMIAVVTVLSAPVAVLTGNMSINVGTIILLLMSYAVVAFLILNCNVDFWRIAKGLTELNTAGVVVMTVLFMSLIISIIGCILNI